MTEDFGSEKTIESTASTSMPSFRSRLLQMMQHSSPSSPGRSPVEAEKVANAARRSFSRSLPATASAVTRSGRSPTGSSSAVAFMVAANSRAAVTREWKVMTRRSSRSATAHSSAICRARRSSSSFDLWERRSATAGRLRRSRRSSSVTTGTRTR